MDLLEDLKMLLLNFNFVMIYIIQKMLVLLTLKIASLNAFLKSIIDFLIIFSQHMMESLSLEEGNIIKDIRNLFRLKKELNYTATKDIKRN